MATMLALFNSVTTQFNFGKYRDKLNVDNGALKLHYRVTAPLLFASSIVVTAQQFIGDRIACIQSAGAIPDNVLNTYCYFVGTTTWNNNTSDFPHRGIGPERDDVMSIRHLYYQWVSYYLFFLSLLFFSAHFLWKSFEKHRLAQITAGFECVKFAVLKEKQVGNIPSIVQREEKIDKLTQILWSRIRNDMNNDWTLKLIAVEMYAFVVVLFVFWLTDVFLGGGGNFVSMTVDSAFRTFPTETSCIFYKYGPSGSIQKHDALCILATNIVNVYIFLFFYPWMLILIIIGALALLWRLVGVFAYRSDWFNRITPFNHINSLVDEDARRTVFKTLNYFDWVFLNYVAENVDGSTYRDVFLNLATTIKEDRRDELNDEEKPFASDHD
ncbi:innexin inx7-like [Neocloeon triangulifer]|uniref:innexin inx7-like n=1 Tax=Neocloeon triangulifer TaxID=2078957 RepID=UPI00286F3A74|nr:innexin inx7-like [Neocloeon triangulifer]